MSYALQLAGLEGQTDGELCYLGEGGTDGKDLSVRTCICGSAHVYGCVVDGNNAIVSLMSSIITNVICSLLHQSLELTQFPDCC